MLVQTDSGNPPLAENGTRALTGLLVRTLLRVVAANFNLRPALRRYLRSDTGWIDFAVSIRTETHTAQAAIVFCQGRVTVRRTLETPADIELIFASDEALRRLLAATPTEQIFMLMGGDLRTVGNSVYMNLFFFFLSLLLSKKQKKSMAREKIAQTQDLRRKFPEQRTELSDAVQARRKNRLRAAGVDPGVRYLSDPYLADLDMEDFPRLQAFLDIHFDTTPEICPERPARITEWHKANGFETDNEGKPWIPELRQGHVFKDLMEHRRPIIRKNDLLAGTTTAKEIGVVVYPDSHGTMIWNELLTVAHRNLNPYHVSEKTRRCLHHEVFPYWISRNFREWVRKTYHRPLCQAIDERFAVYFVWKQAALSHTIPDFPKILAKGAMGIIADARERLRHTAPDSRQAAVLNAMVLCLEGLCAYSENLARQASVEAEAEADPQRRAELEAIARHCRQVVAHPARTLDEAVQAVWITWVGLHMENTNAGLSMGRLDQWLQPYFAADLERLETPKERQAYIRHAVELVGCLFMRCTDHLPLTPDLANWYFGGSSSDQAITLGGVTPEGTDAVCDMTYIFLKVTEILSIRDPNVNARFCPGINSDDYLRRLCEVNLITAATPSMHNDRTMARALAPMGYAAEDINNWSATGCVEPTLSGRHMGHTNFCMINMVAALEMALNNGRHPVMDWRPGPATGSVEDGDFATFEDFFQAFCIQFGFLIDNTVAYNDMLGRAHQVIRPTPLLSSFIDDCLETATDATRGGARYNSSGAACIGLADVTDSLMAIRRLVFEEKRVAFADLKRAVDENFQNHAALHARVAGKVPFFGSGSEAAVALANRITRFARDRYGSHTNYRGGKYTAGFWSMSNHVIYGNLSGALPSGRLAGRPFTPGLTPEPGASNNLLDNLRDVASLDPENLNNNIAFNVKVVPGADRAKTVETMFAYVKTYFELGGMQMQMNVVTSETLRDAMAHPENYRNLLVRISGYNAYFVTLNRDMQRELIARAEYGL